MNFIISQTETNDQAFQNTLFFNPQDFALIGRAEGVVELRGSVFKSSPLENVPTGKVFVSTLIRTYLMLELDQSVEVKPFVLPNDESIYLDTLVMGIQLSKAPDVVDVDCRAVSADFVQRFVGQVLQRDMQLALPYRDASSKRYILRMTIQDLALLPKVNNQEDKVSTSSNPIISSLKAGLGGVLTANTQITFTKVGNSPIRLTGQVTKKSASNMINTDFQKLGIGGLNREFGDILRRAFVSRILPPDVVRKLGIKHVRGMMLYGPPGCGKTLIARQISKVLQGGENAREPKIVSGPEILSKYVGDSEKNVRELFADAEKEQMEAGDDSELHVIIFDEIDAICRQRGSKRDGTGVGDSVVNQLLAKIDGVNSLNNVLLIGMTNRLDMIDNALLRPGRFEVQIEIGLPDEQGRLQILDIHTKSMREGNCLSEDVDLTEIAKETKNFSGAEIEGLVKSAVSFATQRHIDVSDLSKLLDADKISVTASDFYNALDEVHPAFGVQAEDELKGLYRNGILPFSKAFEHLNETLRSLALQSHNSDRTPLLSVLLHGDKGSGKTALVAKLAMEAGFPFTKLISAEDLIGMGDNMKSLHIASIFEDAYKSPLSLIVLDDIERLIEYIRIGPRFSNPVLQALLVLVNRPPPRDGRRLMIIGTTSIPEDLAQLGIVQAFNVDLALPLLENGAEVASVINHLTMEQKDPLEVDSADLKLISENCKVPISIKSLLMVIEMARQGDQPLGYHRFMECLGSVGL